MERQPFNVCEAPLSGTTLIEASAGTGKTQTITDLYVRLLLETAHPVSQILVVTFTTAATAELRDRLRRPLHLFPDSSYAYTQAGCQGHQDPLRVARTTWEGSEHHQGGGARALLPAGLPGHGSTR